MTTTVTHRNSYTAAELAAFRLPGFPTARKNWYLLAAKNGWEVIARPGRGPGGVTRTFVPPPEVQALINEQRRTAADNDPIAGRTTARRAGLVETPRATYHVDPEQAIAGPVDRELLANCIAACSLAYGHRYDAAPVGEQVRVAADLYNVLLNMTRTLPGGLRSVLRLGPTGTAEQLRLLLHMGILRDWREDCGSAAP